MRAMNSSEKILALVGAASIALAAVCTRLGFPGELAAEYGVTLRIFLVLVGFAGLLYLGAVAVVLRGDLPPRALWGILACAALMRLLVLPVTPFLSTDVYRYVWDGRVQDAGISPYRYVPDAPELNALRDDQIHPQINRAHYAPTIYPPAAQAIFFLVGKAGSTVVAMKAAMVLFEALAIFVAIKLLAIAGLPRERILIYAWNPLPLWEFAGNGHVDAAAIGFIALALLACVRGRPLFAGMALGAAAMVKFLPAVLFPALWRRWDMKMPAGFVAVVAGFYLCYAGVGWKVLGFLPSYFSEEGLNDGSGFYYPLALERLTQTMPAAAYPVLALIVLGALAWRVAFARKPAADECSATLALARHMLLLATALTILLTPHYAWYFAWLALPACLVPSFSVLYLTVAAFFLYLDPGHTALLWRGLVYGVFPALAIAELWWHRRGRAGPAVSTQWRTTR
jgi:alpha-1,6-mannosyltransferase